MAVTVRHSVPLGGGLKLTVADYTATQADGTQTLGVSGGKVWGAWATSQDSTGAQALPMPVRYSVSVTGSVATITLYDQEGVTNGQLVVLHGG